MWKSMLAAAGLFLILGLTWCFYDPVLSLWEVASLSSADDDVADLEQSLLDRGLGAMWALRKGVTSPDPQVRLRSARLLAMMGERNAEALLFDVLARGEDDEDAALAEMLLLSIWDRRDGPATDEAQRLIRLAQGDEPLTREQAHELDLRIKVNPHWVGGYVARCRQHIAHQQWHAAKDDALKALTEEANHFEAIVLFGRSMMRLGYPERARQAFEQALKVNPRLEEKVRSDLEQARKDAAAERERRLLEEHLELPVL